MRARTLVTACVVMSASACLSARPRTATAYQGTAIVQARIGADASEVPPWIVGGGVELPAGSWDMSIAFDVPRPQPLEWTVTCPGAVETGRAAANEMSGATRITTRLTLTTTSPGVCAVTALADDATVLGTFAVSRALPSRGPGPATVVMPLGSPVEAKAAHEAKLRARAEADARLFRLKQAATRHEERQAVAPPSYQPALDPEQQRLDIALRAREQLRLRWMAWGAIARPPMPDPLAEDPGEPPFPGAVWTPGRWVWTEGQWQWRAGYWSSPDVFDEPSYGDADLGFGLGWGWSSGGDSDRDRGPRIRDHRDGGPKIRDHRDGSSWGGNVRDHRDEKPTPTIRDHRDANRRESWQPSNRDDDNKSDDKKDDVQIRDHRRR